MENDINGEGLRERIKNANKSLKLWTMVFFGLFIGLDINDGFTHIPKYILWMFFVKLVCGNCPTFLCTGEVDLRCQTDTIYRVSLRSRNYRKWLC